MIFPKHLVFKSINSLFSPNKVYLKTTIPLLLHVQLKHRFVALFPVSKKVARSFCFSILDLYFDQFHVAERLARLLSPNRIN